MKKYKIIYIHPNGLIGSRVIEAINEWEAVYEDAYTDATGCKVNYLKEGWLINNVELVPNETEVDK